ncbi:translin-like [Salvia divinorum]|uniref:Translin-like n=1 Tax=Salvia divinorum TaxID=28513 RepID=A0ABD1GB10_SALDI
MKTAFRSAICATLAFSSRFLNPTHHCHSLILLYRPRRAALFPSKPSPFTSMASADSSDAALSPTIHVLEKQFEEFRHQLDDSASLRERIRSVSFEIESATRLMHSSLMLVHQSRPIPEVLEKAKGQIDVLRGLFCKLAEIIRECPGQYYRYHGDWRSETQAVVSVLAFMHYLETESLLLHAEVEEKLGLNPSEFGLDTEDYLTGICFMSNDLPRYVVNRVTAGDYDCPRKVLTFLTDLHAAFRMLNLRNDFLRKKFDGMKYDLRKVEEVHYDVKIRGLATNAESKGDGEKS